REPRRKLATDITGTLIPLRRDNLPDRTADEILARESARVQFLKGEADGGFGVRRTDEAERIAPDRVLGHPAAGPGADKNVHLIDVVLGSSHRQVFRLNDHDERTACRQSAASPGYLARSCRNRSYHLNRFSSVASTYESGARRAFDHEDR